MLTLVARPLRLPEAEVRQRTFGQAAIARWQDLYGIDFHPLLDAAIPGPTHTITEGEVVSTWPVAGPCVPLCEVDLARFEYPAVSGSALLTIDEPGPINAVAVTFVAQLHGTITHTLDPWRWPTSSWGTSVWVLAEPLDVPDGSALRVTYHRRVEGHRDGLSCDVVVDGSAR